MDDTKYYASEKRTISYGYSSLKVILNRLFCPSVDILTYQSSELIKLSTATVEYLFKNWSFPWTILCLFLSFQNMGGGNLKKESKLNILCRIFHAVVVVNTRDKHALKNYFKRGCCKALFLFFLLIIFRYIMEEPIDWSFPRILFRFFKSWTEMTQGVVFRKIQHLK